MRHTFRDIGDSKLVEVRQLSSSAYQSIAHALLGPKPPVRIRFPDGSAMGPTDAKTTIVVRSDDALKHIVRAPGELGVARAYVSGSLDVEGDLWGFVDLQDRLPDVHFSPRETARLLRLLGADAILHPPAIPAEEVSIGGPLGRHTRRSDAEAISHHYDVGNEFYRLVLGPSWTYSCAVFTSAEDSLEQAQAQKYDLIARKLGLKPGMRLLDVGCGWGGMVLHAAQHYGVKAVGITISAEQAKVARERVSEAGLADRVEIRIQDYRDLNDGPFDAISSIGMFEHVGADQLRRYFELLHGLLVPGGRLLNHQIGRRPSTPNKLRVGSERTAVHRRGFVHRYVFPNGELHEIGALVNGIQRSGFEVRHVESLREHYAATLRHWVNNLDANWPKAVALVGEGRARVWRLYMAGSSSQFRTGRIEIHQVLATKSDGGISGMGWRPTW